MNILGQAPDGTEIDLESFLELVCSDFIRLKKFVKNFSSANPEWNQLAIEAAQKYFSHLATIEPDENSLQTAKQLGLAVKQVLLANKISLMILFGYSHYLQWAGFDIVEPTGFKEISKKLLFARKTVAKLGFYLALRTDLEDRPISPSQTILNLYELGFSIGVTLGYLTVEIHSKGLKSVLDMLERGALCS